MIFLCNFLSTVRGDGLSRGSESGFRPGGRSGGGGGGGGVERSGGVERGGVAGGAGGAAGSAGAASRGRSSFDDEEHSFAR